MASPDLPLLVLPDPVRADRARRRGWGRKTRRPNPVRQAARVAPQFQRLRDAMAERRLALQDSRLGIVPEQVLVIETVGSISPKFCREAG